MANILEVCMQSTIKHLARQGWSIRRIARELGINRRTVAKYTVEFRETSKCTTLEAEVPTGNLGKCTTLSFAYHTRGISGFQHHSFQYSDGNVIQRLKRKEFRCPKCSHCSVNTYPHRTRRIQGLPYGRMPVYFEVELHRMAPCFSTSLLTLHFFPNKSRLLIVIKPSQNKS